MTISDSVLIVLLVILVALLAMIPVLLARIRRAARARPSKPVISPAPAEEKPASPRPRMQITPEERDGQSGGALMQDTSALQSEYRPVDALHDAPPVPRKNGKH